MSAEADEKLARSRLVVFGCGYVGAAAAAQAQARGMAVTALTRNAANAVLLREEGIETVVADLAGDAWHGRIAGSPDFVLNCVSAAAPDVDGYRHSYVAGMASILAWARRHGTIGTLVYTSSTSVYPQDGGMTVDETAPATGGGEHARVLLEAENLLAGSAGACERWFILRVAGIYGPGRHHLLDQVRSGRASGTGEPHLNLAHRDDIVAAILACFGAPARVANRMFNVVDDSPARKAEVVAWLVRRLGVPPPRLTGEPAGGRRAVTRDRVITNAQIKAALGWRPRYPSYREGYENLLSR
jgi:nucleoside-diphosphate-sugar epimerase